MTLRVERIISVHFAPTLRAEGFTGSGRTFRRIRHGQIHVVNVQGSRYGGQFAVNLGIQPLTLPDAAGRQPDPRNISESACELRRRLSDVGVDQWWSYQDHASLERAVIDACTVYEAHGRPVFDAMSAPPSPLDTMTVDQLANGSEALQGFSTTKVRLALMLARLREADDRIAEAAKFAAYAMQHAIKTFALMGELERIAALPYRLPRRGE